MTEAEAYNRTYDLIRVIESVSTDARWQIPQPITVDFVTDRIAGGDRVLAATALNALKTVGVLIETESDGQRVYRLAN